MGWLVAGVLTWSLVHLLPAIAPRWREARISASGENAWKGMFSILIVAGIVLIVIGWRTVDVRAVYAPPLYGSPLVTALMFVSFVLFAAASAPGNIKRFLRHPMLTGTIVWSIAHLLANGENRSVVLFGGIGAWAVVSILLINRRDGSWQRPAPVGVAKDAMTIAGTVVIFGIVVFLHKYLFGVPAIPGL